MADVFLARLTKEIDLIVGQRGGNAGPPADARRYHYSLEEAVLLLKRLPVGIGSQTEGKGGVGSQQVGRDLFLPSRNCPFPNAVQALRNCPITA